MKGRGSGEYSLTTHISKATEVFIYWNEDITYCCKAAGVDFRGWMFHVLTHIHDYDNDYSRDLAELLPDRWVQEKS